MQNKIKYIIQSLTSYFDYIYKHFLHFTDTLQTRNKNQ